MTIRVVVADDHAVVREGVATALDAHPEIEVVGKAIDGLSALALVRELDPDVMILDLHMPRLDGLGVLTELRASNARVRVIVMSANEERDSVLDAIFAGAVGYLSKRSSTEFLGNAIVDAHAGGAVLSPSLAAHLVKEFASPSSDEPAGKSSLRGREVEVLRLVVQGKTDVEIGKALFISPRTVQNHLMGIRKKTGLRRRSELTRWAVEHAIG